jgi:hypothetical protein
MISIENPVADLQAVKHAILDDTHIGHINGAMGTILHGDIAPRLGWGARLKTLLAILGPGLIVIAAAVVMTPGTPLGLLTNAVQTLAGVLLPSATVFLLLLANDEAVLGPWVNTRTLNLITGAIVAVLVMLSIILTASVLFPEMGEDVIIGVLAGGSALAVLTAIAVLALRRGESAPRLKDDPSVKWWKWRMPPLHELPPARLTPLNRIWMIVLRAYLVVAAGLVLLRIFRLATAGA